MIKKFAFASVATALLSTSSFAADLPDRRMPPPPPPLPVAAYSWTGFEGGFNTSFAFTNRQPVTSTGNTAALQALVNTGIVPSPVSMYKSNTANIGGGLAYNYQFTPGAGAVIGVKADADWTDLRKFSVINNGLTQTGFNQRLDYLATINGRLGYAFDHFLVYGTGGFAFGRSVVAANYATAAGVPFYFGSGVKTLTGYDFGGGVEYAIPADSFLNNLSIEHLIGLDKAIGFSAEGTIKLEYIHYDLGRQSILAGATNAAPGSYTSTFRTEGNMVRLGLGYKFGSFGGAPVVARY